MAGACSKKDDETTSEPDTTEATGDTEAPDATEAPSATDAPDATDAAPETTEAEAPAKDPVYGGTIVVSGEAEVANPWTPAAMQCDSYCQQRARTFYDPLVALNQDNEIVGVLVDTITPNADFTEWTFTVREGIKFHDGTDLDAAAVVKNLQATGTGLLISGAIVDYGKNADGTLAIEATDAMTFTIKTGKGGDLSQPLPWPNLPATLAGQLGMIASPTWLDAVAADPTLATSPVGTGPFIVESYAPRDKLVVTRNPDYWMKDAAGNQLPYLDSVEFRVIEDSETAAEALQSGDIDIFSTSSAIVISEFRDLADEFPMTEQDSFTETNYILIDLAKPGPLQDQRVRCALWKAIDRQELIDLTADGILQVANGLFSPGQEGYLEDNGVPTEQDLEGAQTLIDEYVAENGPVTVNYGTTVSAINAQVAELLKGYWEQIGVTTEIQQVPQDQFITNALFGDPGFFMYGWRNHAGTTIDGQYFWWHSSASAPDGALALNFGRVEDDVVDENLEAQRIESDPAKRKEFAENVNRRMAEQCYQFANSWTIWGTPRDPAIQGLSTLVFPDGSMARDGAGFSGQFYMHSLWLDGAA
ncbi:MAG: ABC transporter substrate-binding protein [Actinobacteria bacterium]|nr:ABC transporter substrate-binding protein [Actinomycetota bacterium]